MGLEGIGEQPDGGDERQRRPPARLVGVAQEQRECEQDEAREQDDVAAAEEGDEDKAGEVDAENAAGGGDGVEAADDTAGVAESGEGLLAGERRDHAEEATGQEEQAGVQGEGLGNDGEVAKLCGEPGKEGEAGKAGAAGGEEHDADGTGRGKAVGQLTAEEVADADAGEDHADDAGPGIDVDAELGREQTPGDQL